MSWIKLFFSAIFYTLLSFHYPLVLGEGEQAINCSMLSVLDHFFSNVSPSSWYILLGYQLRSHEDVLPHSRNQAWRSVTERQTLNLI